ncbi:hypothetical protein [Lactiplantibacillus pentosus]
MFILALLTYIDKRNK